MHNQSSKLATESQTSQEALNDLELAEAIAPLRSGQFVMGFVHEIHGLDGEEVTGYRPTRCELREIVRYWAKVRLDIALDWFFWESTGSTEIRLDPYAASRLGKLARVLGDDTVEQVLREVRQKERRSIGAGTWRIFTQGTPHEWDEFRELMQTTHQYLDLKRQDKALMDRVFSFLEANPSKVYLDDAGDLWSFTDHSDEHQDNDPEARLMLRVTTPDGASAMAPEYTLIRPSRWQPPYGLR